MKSFFPIPAPACEAFWRLGEAALGLLYPPHCAHCGTDTASGEHLCAECGARVRRIQAPRCERCSQPFEGALTTDFTCSNCADRRFAFTFAVSPFRATGVVRELIHRFKYQRHFYLRRQLAAWMAEGMSDPRLQNPPVEALVPVPLHSARQREREFNQAAVLARELAALAPLPVEDLLQRTRYTSTQTQLDREERMENLRGAFRLRQHGGEMGRHLLLIDDVFTTGSTVEECARVLTRAGAASVRVLTVARAV